MRFTTVRRFAVAVCAAAIGLTAAVAVPTSASAAPLDAIESVTIISPNPENPSAPLSVGDEFTLEAEWSLPHDALPGDTFGLTFPSPVSVAWAQSFDLRAPDGSVVGTCTARGQSIDCTLGEYVRHHHDIRGSLTVRASAAASTEADDVSFETSSGAIVAAPLPGGGIIDDDHGHGPETLRKFGGISPEGDAARWAIEVPISHLAELGTGVVVTDTYDSRLTLDPSSVSVSYVAPDGWDEWLASRQSQSVPRDSGEWTFTHDPDTHSFELTFPKPRGAGGWYLVSYATPLPSDATTGDVFRNRVTASGDTLAETSVTYVDAGGHGSGERRRTISITKAVDGGGEAPDVAFTVNLACIDAAGTAVPGFPKDATVRAGETVPFTGIPVGSTCTASEPENGGADSVSFSPSPVVTVETTSPPTIEVVVTNTFEPAVGAFSVTKDVTGAAAGLVDPATEFTVVYRYEADGTVVEREATLRDGGTVTVEDVPAGTVVTLEERAAPSVDGVSWATPVFAGRGVESTATGARFTVGEAETVAVRLDNPAVPSGPPGAPEATPQEPEPVRGSLAVTGSDGGAIVASAIALLVIGAITTMSTRRRAMR